MSEAPRSLKSNHQGLLPRTSLISRNVTVKGHRTSIRLEPEMWEGLNEVCRREYTNFHHICSSVAERKTQQTSLTAAIRVFVMHYFKSSSTEEGHVKAGHGTGFKFATSSDKRPSRAHQSSVNN